MNQYKNELRDNWRYKMHEIIFEADTKEGKLFDIGLIIAIVLSVVVVMLESVSSLRLKYGNEFYIIEWFFTIIFTIEYILRLICVLRPSKYALSFFGIVDLLAVLPTYVDILLPGSHYFIVIRVLRLLRIFRVLKLVQFISESKLLLNALKASRRKIMVFMFTIITLVIVLGSLMYLIEGEEHGFTSIPISIYWAIVTLTTVGYGDLSPQTPLGQTFATLVMVLGYSIIAVPTGIVTVELAEAYRSKTNTQVCQHCLAGSHDNDAKFCKYCGTIL